MLDEPLAALDASVRRDVRRFLADGLRAWRLPTIVVTHDRDDAAAIDGEVIVEAPRCNGGAYPISPRTHGRNFVRQFVDQPPQR